MLFMGILLGLAIEKDKFSMNEHEVEFILNEFQLSFSSIFLNNLVVCLISITGFLSFGLMTLVNTFYNGLVFGHAFIIIYKSEFVSMWNFVPHAVFELVAIFYSATIGLRMSTILISTIWIGDYQTAKSNNLTFICRDSIIIFVSILVGTLIEIYISANL
jgi:uncharacterized membrane protein SpoIIM required for sporulation